MCGVINAFAPVHQILSCLGSILAAVTSPNALDIAVPHVLGERKMSLLASTWLEANHTDEGHLGLGHSLFLGVSSKRRN